MRDKRCVDDLSIEELEQLVLVRRRQARAERLRRLGREVDPADWLADPDDEAAPTPLPPRAPVPAQPAPAAEPPRRGRLNLKWLRDSALLVLEVVALLGLVAVLVASVTNLKELNQEVALAREAAPAPIAATASPGLSLPATPTAEPQIKYTVLPGGHSPPTSSGSVPQRLSDLVQPVVPAPIPTPGPHSPTRIVIPSISVDAPVVEGDDWEQLKKGAAHTIGTANPGERGNCFISAHNDIYGEIFRHLDKVELESKITVYAGDTPYHYVVKAKRIVEPADVSVMAPTASPVLTLMTCYPYMIDTHRLVVIAELTDN